MPSFAARETRRRRPDGEGRLGRLADTMYVHRRKVILGWIALVAVAVVSATSFGGEFTADYNTPGSDSEAASERLEQKFAGRSGDAIDIVWKSAAGAESPAVTDRIDRLLEEAGSVPGVVPGTTAENAEVSRDAVAAPTRAARSPPKSSTSLVTSPPAPRPRRSRPSSS